MLAIRCLARIGPAAEAAVPQLHAIVKSNESFPFRSAAARALTQMGPAGEAAIPTLIELLKNPGELVKTYPSGGSPSAIGLTTPLLHKGGYYDSRDSTILTAIGALGMYGAAAKDAIPEIERIRDDPEMLSLIREGAGQVIADIESEIVKPNEERKSPELQPEEVDE